MKSYKVIKEFACAKKGDILTWNDEMGVYSMEVEEDGDLYRYVGIDANSANDLEKKGILLGFEDEAEDCHTCDSCDKLMKVEELVDKLITTYHNDYENTMKLAEEGKVQPCVRVEAETVYFNLNKVLNKIKNIINE